MQKFGDKCVHGDKCGSQATGQLFATKLIGDNCVHADVFVCESFTTSTSKRAVERCYSMVLTNCSEGMVINQVALCCTKR